MSKLRKTGMSSKSNRLTDDYVDPTLKKSKFKSKRTNRDAESESNESTATKSNVILKGATVTFWSDKPISNNPRYEAKYVLSIALTDKHISILARAKEAAIMKFIESENNGVSVPLSQFDDKLFEREDGTMTLTFRSNNDFKLDTEYEEEMIDTDLRIGKGTKINIAVNAWAYTANKSHGLQYYANAINIVDLVEREAHDLRKALRG